jgi:hypothetical protein
VHSAGELADGLHPLGLLQSCLCRGATRRQMSDDAQRGPDSGTENGVEDNTPMPRTKGDIFIDRIRHIDRVGIELSPAEKMRNATWRYAPFFVLDAAGNGPHQVGGRWESSRLTGARIRREQSSIPANENRSVTKFRIESTKKIFEVLDPDLNPEDAVEVAGG